MRHTLITCASLVAVACNHGMRPQDFGPANGPEGAVVAVRVDGESTDRIGELFAVESSGVTIAMGGVTYGERRNAFSDPTMLAGGTPSQLIRIAWPRIKAIDVDRMGNDYDVHLNETVGADKRARLALLSRFPQGLTPTLLAAILKAVNQNALAEIK